MVDGAFHDREVTGVVGVAEGPPGDLVQVVDVAVGVDHHDQLGEGHHVGPPDGVHHLLRVLRYFLSIETIAQLWKPPDSGRW